LGLREALGVRRLRLDAREDLVDALREARELLGEEARRGLGDGGGAGVAGLSEHGIADALPVPGEIGQAPVGVGPDAGDAEELAGTRRLGAVHVAHAAGVTTGDALGDVDGVRRRVPELRLARRVEGREAEPRGAAEVLRADHARAAL